MDLNRLRELAGLNENNFSSELSTNKLEKYNKYLKKENITESDDIKKGAFHKWLGKSEDEPITDADVEKGLRSDNEHVRKMAQFAKNMREHSIKESAPSDEEDFIKDSKDDFKKRYGKRWKQVLYATAWKKHNKKDVKEAIDIANSIYNLIKLQEASGIDIDPNDDLVNEPRLSFYVYDRCKRKGHRVSASSLPQAVEFVAPGAELYQGDPDKASQDEPAKYIGVDECQYQAFPVPAAWGFRESFEDEKLTNSLNEDKHLYDYHLSYECPDCNHKWETDSKFDKDDECPECGSVSLPKKVSKTIRESLDNAKKLAKDGHGDNPKKTSINNSEIPKVEFINGPPKNLLNATEVEFNDDKYQFNKVMTGQDIEAVTKVKVPDYVLNSIDKRIKELKDSIKIWDDKGYTQDGAIYKNVKHNAIELLDKFKKLLDTKNVQEYKEAQVLYGTLMSPITDLFPAQLVNFLHNGHNEPKKKI